MAVLETSFVTGESAIRSYKDLEVWQVAMDVAVACYRVTAKFPREEIYSLTAQIRRAAASVAANIAEGYGRETTASFIQFLRIAQGSLKELETHLLLASRVELAEAGDLAPLLDRCERISKMLRNLIRALAKGQRTET
jgi:four helix bundle protein